MPSSFFAQFSSLVTWLIRFEGGEWDIILGLCDATCGYGAGRVYIISGLESAFASEEDVHALLKSGRGLKVVALLLKFVKGDWEGDMRHALPAMKILCSVWTCLVDRGGPTKEEERALVEVCTVLHAATKDKDGALCKAAGDAMARILSLTKAEKVTPEVWVSLFRNVLLYPPKIRMVAGGNGKSVYVVNEDVRVR